VCLKQRTSICCLLVTSQTTGTMLSEPSPCCFRTAPSEALRTPDGSHVVMTSQKKSYTKLFGCLHTSEHGEADRGEVQSCVFADSRRTAGHKYRSTRWYCESASTCRSCISSQASKSTVRPTSPPIRDARSQHQRH